MLVTAPATPLLWTVKFELLLTFATVPLTSNVPAVTVEVPTTCPLAPTVAVPPLTPKVPPIRPSLVSMPLVVVLSVIFPLFVKLPAFASEATVPAFVPLAPTLLVIAPTVPPLRTVKIALLLTDPTPPLTSSVPSSTVVPPV